MGKILQFPDKESRKKQEKDIFPEELFTEFPDNKLDKLLEDMMNLPTDEEELINTMQVCSELERRILYAMSVKNYEKFYFLKVSLEGILESVISGAYKHDLE